MENITLDPEYENLIVEVNNLKDKVAEKIAERDSLAFHVIPEIEAEYMSAIGSLENEAFFANMKLLRLNRKRDLYKERLDLGIEINEKEIENKLDLEFDTIEEEYVELVDDNMYDEDDAEEYLESSATELLKLVNIMYKNLIKKLSPLINFDNTRLDNQLYELLEKSYRDLDISMLSKLQLILESSKPESSITIGDVKALQKAKTKYEKLIKENEEIIEHIRTSDTFERKKVLEDDELIEKTKEEIKADIDNTMKKCKELEDEIEIIVSQSNTNKA